MEDAKSKKSHPKESNNGGRRSLRSYPLWQKIVAGAIIFIVVIFVIATMATSGVVKVSNQFVNDIQAKNASAAYALMTSAAQAATPQSDFNDMVDRVAPIIGNSTEKMTSKEASGQTGSAATGKVVYEIKGSDGVTYVMTVNLQKENGEWRVLNFESTRK